MIRTLHLKLLLLGCLILGTLQMKAQGWEKKYSPDLPMAINAIYPTHDGNYLTTGWDVGSSINHQRIMKVASNGDVIWKSDIDSLYGPDFANITQDHGLIILARGSTLVRVDSNGTQLWRRVIHPGRTASTNGNADIDTTDNHGFIFIYTAVDSTVSRYPIMYIDRLDSAGDLLWEQSYATTDTAPIPYALRNSRDGGFIISAGHNYQSGCYAFKIDGSGNILWQYPGLPQYFLYPSVSRDGNILLISAPLSPSVNGIIKLDQSGHTLWSQTYPTLSDSSFWFGLMGERADGTFALIGSRNYNNGFSSTDRFSLSIVDSTGHIGYFKKIATSNLGPNIETYETNYRGNISTPDGGYLFGGWIQNDPAGYSGFLIKTDSTGLVYPSLLSGNVFWDANNNCSKDAGETYMTPVYLTLTNGGDTFTTVTIDSGYFTLGLYAGSYGIQVQPPSPYWQASSCDPTGGTLAVGADTSILLGLTPILSSPYITINGHMGHQVICRPVVYTAQYCNTGTAPFTGSIEIDVDTMLRIDSASIHIASQTGNQLTFDVDTLGIMQCATIEVYCTVPCGVSYLNRTTCTNAQAFQDTIVNPSPLWDRSNLRMSVAYNPVTDSITFSLKNYGTGSMSGPKGMIVIEDNVILMTQPVQLPAATQIQQQIKANGSTWRATIDQTDYNPYSKFTTAAIEAAGTNTSGTVSLGYITQYPYNGYTSYQDNTCAEINGSYDPNEKAVAPKGAGPNQLVDTNVALEYTIDFQNTGTAPAYTVKVTDTLAPYLDIATARLEICSSHCQMQISGRNLIIFTFDNINLPDSSAGQQQSTGFVKFRVNQKPGNVNGTVINNKAGVYFDYNAPVITNTATVRIGQVLVTGIQNVYPYKAVQISAYPNPFLSNTTIKVEGENFSDLQLDIYGINGQLVKHQNAKNTNSFNVDRNELNTGDYVFKITSNGKPVGNGKIIVQ